MIRLCTVAFVCAVIVIFGTAGASDCATISTKRMVAQLAIAIPVAMVSLWVLRKNVFGE